MDSNNRVNTVQTTLFQNCYKKHIVYRDPKSLHEAWTLSATAPEIRKQRTKIRSLEMPRYLILRTCTCVSVVCHRSATVYEYFLMWIEMREDKKSIERFMLPLKGERATETVCVYGFKRTPQKRTALCISSQCQNDPKDVILNRWGLWASNSKSNSISQFFSFDWYWYKLFPIIVPLNCCRIPNWRCCLQWLICSVI